MAQPPDAAIQQRIITHMNKDHPDSLSRYLEHYAGLSHFSARSPQLETITLTSLHISSAGSATQTIPLSPPLSSWEEARPRLVSMHEECGAKLGRDNSITAVTQFRWPGVLHSAILAGVFLGLWCFADGKNFAPGSLLASTLFRPVPLLARAAEAYHWWIWWVIVVVHAVEAWLMVGKLERCNVALFSRVWWLYVVFVAMEGYGCVVRFKAEVREERRRKIIKDGKH